MWTLSATKHVSKGLDFVCEGILSHNFMPRGVKHWEVVIFPSESGVVFAEQCEAHIHVNVQPLRLDMRPNCVLQLCKMLEVADPPRSFHHRRMHALRQLDSVEGRLKAQLEFPAVEAFPLGVSLLVTAAPHPTMSCLPFAFVSES